MSIDPFSQFVQSHIKDLLENDPAEASALTAVLKRLAPEPDVPNGDDAANAQTLFISMFQHVGQLAQMQQTESLRIEDTQVDAPLPLVWYLALKELIIRRTVLENPPNMDLNHDLEELVLENNELTVSPNLKKNRRLTSVSLEGNEIIIPPNVSHNHELTSLRLGSNELEIPPVVSKNPRLRILGLQENHLTTPPDISQNPELSTLYLENNQLTTAPDVTHNSNLMLLSLNCNDLTSLHDSILELPCNCRVEADGNLFSEGYIEYFQERLAAVRERDPTRGPTVTMSIDYDRLPEQPTLPFVDRLRNWSDEFERELPQDICPEYWIARPRMTGDEEALRSTFQGLFSLDEDEQAALEIFLGKLTETADYIFTFRDPEAKQRLLSRVDRILRRASENKDFRALMMTHVMDGTTDCSDRTILILQGLDIEFEMTVPRTEESMRSLCIMAERYNQLYLYALEDAKKRKLGDEVEVALYYLLYLKNVLYLPIYTLYMLYPGTARVSRKRLQQAHDIIASLSEEVLLNNSDHWTRYLSQKHHERVQEYLENTDMKYVDLLERAKKYCDLSSESEKPLQQILQEHQDLCLSPHVSDYRSACGDLSARKRHEIARYVRAVEASVLVLPSPSAADPSSRPLKQRRV